MIHSIRKLVADLVNEFDLIPKERKQILTQIAAYMQARYVQDQPVQLVFICTHNSRRSHFGQIAAALAAEYYAMDKVRVYSGGTEATAFHPNAIRALRELGFEVSAKEEPAVNPVWEVQWGEYSVTTCFSKTFDDAVNPTQGFAAIMTCSDAEENCPFVPGTELRVATTYLDPKVSDGTPEQQATYIERFRQIAREQLYAFSLIR